MASGIPSSPKSINLIESVNAVLDAWLLRIKAELGATTGKSDEFLIDHMPRFLRSLAHALAEPENLKYHAETLDNAKTHGVQRASSGAYTTTDVVTEYSILRELIVSTLAENSPLSLGEAKTIARIFETSIGAATEEFVTYKIGGSITRLKIEGTRAPSSMLEAERSAALAREDLKQVADAVSTIIVKFDLDYRYVFVNRAYQEWFGRPASSVLGRKFSDVADRGLHDIVLDYLEKSVHGQGGSFERVLPKATGAPELAFLSFTPARDLEGEVVGVVVTIQSIEGQKRARDVIEASETRLRSIFSHTSVGFAISEIDGRFVEVNPRFCEITGFSAEELKTKRATDIVHEDDLAKDRQMIKKLTAGEIPNFILEKRYVKKNGDVAWLRNSVSLVPGEAGSPLIIRVSEDVTAVRKAEMLRKESEERFTILANSMPQIVWTADAEGNLDYFNNVWFDYSGTNFEDNVGQGWAKAVHEGDLAKTAERWGKSLRDGSNYENEFRLRSASGEYRWHVARATPAFGGDGKINKWYGTNTDIHDVKLLVQDLARANRDVETEQQKFRTIFADSSTQMAVLQGREFIYEIANPSYLKLFNNRDIVGRRFVDALPELKDQSFPQLAKNVFETGTPYKDPEAVAYLKRTDEGPLEERYFDQTYTQMIDEEGNPYGVFIHAIEVTEKVAARRAYQETAERLRLAVEAANMGTWSMEPRTGLIDWSARTRDLFGVKDSENIPLEAALRRIHPDDREKTALAIQQALDPKGDGTYQTEYRIIHDGNETRWVSLLGRAFFEDAPNGRVAARFSGTVLDVTDRIVAEVSLRDAKERAEMANAAKSSFLANMSHEIRTPLGAIMGFVSLIKDEDVNTQTLHQYVTVIERNSVQLMRIIDDILDLSKVEAGMMLIEHIEFSLIELLSDFASFVGFRAREKGILFELKAQTQLPDIVISDPTRIRQILTNIVGNAIKFTDHGSVHLRVSYVGDELTFEVEDTGRGIAADQVDQLFQAFSQGDPSTTRKYGGTGLGLVLTRRLSEALGGQFSLVKSVEGKGSTFTAAFKVGLSKRSHFVKALGFASEPIRNAGVQGLLKNLRVLLVEDSPDNQALFSIYLNRAGAKIDIASDGERGFEMAMTGDYDVVLMDVQMPIMDGITAVKKLRAAGSKLPIIALTAHAMKEEKIRCLEAGYTSFLSKPVQRLELVDALKPYRKADPV